MSNLPKANEFQALVEQLTKDLNQAHDELLRAQGVTDPSKYEWPEWSPQANSIRWAERLLGMNFAKTDGSTVEDAPASAKDRAGALRNLGYAKNFIADAANLLDAAQPHVLYESKEDAKTIAWLIHDLRDFAQTTDAVLQRQIQAGK